MADLEDLEDLKYIKELEDTQDYILKLKGELKNINDKIMVENNSNNSINLKKNLQSKNEELDEYTVYIDKLKEFIIANTEYKKMAQVKLEAQQIIPEHKNMTLISQNGGFFSSSDILNRLPNIQYSKGISDDNVLSILFLEEDNPQTTDNTRWLGKGSFTVVCKIQILSTNNPILQDSTKRYIMRINRLTQDIPTDVKPDNSNESKIIDNFITKYNADKVLIPDNIIDIYYYGLLTVPNTQYKFSYFIVPIYETYSDSAISTLEYSDKCKIITNLIHCLQTLENNGYIHEDLKITNIGWSPYTYKCKLIDYDQNTIHKLLDINNNLVFTTTYIPLYLLINNNFSYLDKDISLKYHIGGLLNIIFALLNIQQMPDLTLSDYASILTYNKITIIDSLYVYLKNLIDVNIVPEHNLLAQLIYKKKGCKHYGLLSNNYKNIPPYELLLKLFDTNNLQQQDIDKWISDIDEISGGARHKYYKYKNKNKTIV
jgi:hypothetical protein